MSVVEYERYSLAQGIHKYKKYLGAKLGAPLRVTVDHKPLEYLKTKQIKNPKLL